MASEMWGINVDLTQDLATMARQFAEHFGAMRDMVSAIVANGSIPDGGSLPLLSSMNHTAATLASLLIAKLAQITESTYVGLPIEQFISDLENDLADGFGSDGMSFARAIEAVTAAMNSGCLGSDQSGLDLEGLAALGHDANASSELQAAVQYLQSHPEKWRYLGTLDGNAGNALSLRDVELMRLSPDIVAATQRATSFDALDGNLDGVIDHQRVAQLLTSDFALDSDALELRTIAVDVLSREATMRTVDIAAELAYQAQRDTSFLDDVGDWASRVGWQLVRFVGACASGIDDAAMALGTGSAFGVAATSMENLAPLLAVNPELVPVLVAGAGVVAVTTACLVGVGNGSGLEELQNLVDEVHHGEDVNLGEVIEDAQIINDKPAPMISAG
jgi:hypothetical protein